MRRQIYVALVGIAVGTVALCIVRVIAAVVMLPADSNWIGM